MKLPLDPTKPHHTSHCDSVMFSPGPKPQASNQSFCIRSLSYKLSIAPTDSVNLGQFAIGQLLYQTAQCKSSPDHIDGNTGTLIFELSTSAYML